MDSVSERLTGPNTVLNWPSVSRLWHPSKSQFQSGHGAREKELVSRHERRDLCVAEGWAPPGSWTLDSTYMSISQAALPHQWFSIRLSESSAHLAL